MCIRDRVVLAGAPHDEAALGVVAGATEIGHGRLGLRERSAEGRAGVEARQRGRSGDAVRITGRCDSYFPSAASGVAMSAASDETAEYTGQVEVGGTPDVRELPGLRVTKEAVGPYNNNCYLLRDAASTSSDSPVAASRSR